MAYGDFDRRRWDNAESTSRRTHDRQDYEDDQLAEDAFYQDYWEDYDGRQRYYRSWMGTDQVGDFLGPSCIQAGLGPAPLGQVMTPSPGFACAKKALCVNAPSIPRSWDLITAEGSMTPFAPSL